MGKSRHYHIRHPEMISWVQTQTVIERRGHWLLFIIGVAISFFVPLPTEKLYLNTIATVGALLASLTGVSASILLTLQTDIANALRKKGWYKNLMGYAHVSVSFSILMTLAAIAGFFLTNEYESIYKPILFGLILCSLGAFYRVFWLLIRIGGFYRAQQ